jgi:hypothetical protein
VPGARVNVIHGFPELHATSIDKYSGGSTHGRHRRRLLRMLRICRPTVDGVDRPTNALISARPPVRHAQEHRSRRSQTDLLTWAVSGVPMTSVDAELYAIAGWSRGGGEAPMGCGHGGRVQAVLPAPRTSVGRGSTTTSFPRARMSG